jgi:hypothetical protein
VNGKSIGTIADAGKRCLQQIGGIHDKHAEIAVPAFH